jgi:hypothetical protein
MTELKACPFCGSEAETDVPPMRREVTCTDCGAFALTVGAWNTRPEEDTLRAYVARLQRLNIELCKDFNASVVARSGQKTKIETLQAEVARLTDLLSRAVDDIEKGWLAIEGVEEKYNTDGSWHVVQDIRAALAHRKADQ